MKSKLCFWVFITVCKNWTLFLNSFDLKFQVMNFSKANKKPPRSDRIKPEYIQVLHFFFFFLTKVGILLLLLTTQFNVPKSVQLLLFDNISDSCFLSLLLTIFMFLLQHINISLMESTHFFPPDSIPSIISKVRRTVLIVGKGFFQKN